MRQKAVSSAITAGNGIDRNYKKMLLRKKNTKKHLIRDIVTPHIHQNP